MKMDWITETVKGNEVVFYRYDTKSGPDTGIEYKATRTISGDKFTIATHDGKFENVPFLCDFDNYREMDMVAAVTNWELTPAFVCHVAHNEENAYVLWAKGKSYYIRVEN